MVGEKRVVNDISSNRVIEYRTKGLASKQQTTASREKNIRLSSVPVRNSYNLKIAHN